MANAPKISRFYDVINIISCNLLYSKLSIYFFFSNLKRLLTLKLPGGGPLNLNAKNLPNADFFVVY